MKWKKVELGDVITLQRGYDLPASAREEGPYPVISSGGLSDFHADFKERGPGVVTGRYGSVGSVYYTEDNYWPHNTTLFVKDFKGNNPRFVYYLLQTLGLENNNDAGAVPGVNRQSLHAIKVMLPEPSLQHQIATILVRYDTLLANYQQQITTLEALAQEIYREWFVRGRCPGAIIPPGAELPTGWERVKFTDIISVQSGGTPQTSVADYWDGDVYWFSPGDTTGSFYVLSTDKTITEEGLKNCNSKLYPVHTVVITARGTVGKCVLLGRPMAINQSNYALIGKRVSQYFTFFATLAMAEALQQEANGAVFSTITTANFERADLILPNTDSLAAFDAVVAPMFSRILNLQVQSALLRETRDALLPRLLSGQLSPGALPTATPV